MEGIEEDGERGAAEYEEGESFGAGEGCWRVGRRRGAHLADGGSWVCGVEVMALLPIGVV